MSPRHTWFWIFIAAGLFAFILVSHRVRLHSTPGSTAILPRLKPSAVTAVQVMPKGQLPIRAERTNDVWQLSKPLVYPAQAVSVENLLTVLDRLIPATHIAESEVKNRFNADEEYGFADPQATIALEQGDYNPRLRIGIKTPPGDQVFLQVVGVEGAYVVDADLLQFIPRSANDWRDTALVNLKGRAFDRIAVTNGAKIFVLQNDPANHLWRMVRPFEARAYNGKIEDSLVKLANLRIQQFVSDDPKADLEPLGLQPAELALALAQGTNTIALLQFGKPSTNDAHQVYARLQGRAAIATVAADLLAPWRAPPDDFRDPHLLSLTNEVQTIEVRGEDNFSLERKTNDTWIVLPQNFPADAALVKELLSRLTELQVGFAKDNVTDLGLGAYGLASPRREYILKAGAAGSGAGMTNLPLVDLSFGTNQEEVVFARRADERSVYSVKLADFESLPAWGWQLRQRRLWNLSENDLARITIRQQGSVRQLIRKGLYQWSLAPGSQGLIDDLANEETARGLIQATATVWVARGDQNRARYGFTDKSPRITLELKNGDSVTVELGGPSPSTMPYVATSLDEKLWIFELPPKLCRDVLRFLTIPPGP